MKSNLLHTERQVTEDAYGIDNTKALQPSRFFLDLFPEELYQISLFLYGKEVIVNLKDVLLLAEGINFEMRVLSDRSSEQMDVTLERIASYRLTIVTAVEQLNEIIFDKQEEVNQYIAQLKDFAYETILNHKLLEFEQEKRTKSTVGNITASEIETFIYNLSSLNNEDLPIREYQREKRNLQILKSKKEKLEKLENILLNRGKELISILERRINKYQ